jgi:hypothetical protein
MKTALTLAASVVINLTALAAFDWSVNQSQLPPRGEVTITQLADSTEALVDVREDAAVVRTAASL